MSREILFKAKRLSDGKWVEGYYIYHIKRTICPMGDRVKPEDEQHVIMCDGFSDWNLPRGTVCYEIDPTTLCQYTGLTDKNGKKIWENDVVKTHYANAKRCDFIETVVFHNGRFCAEMNLFRNGKTWANLFDGVPHISQDKSVYMDSVEVIGNIFDNPELLKGDLGE